MKAPYIYINLVLMFFILVACEHSNSTGPEDNTQPPAGTPMTFSKVQSDVFTLNCAFSGCHGGSQRPNLSAGLAYGNIVNVAGSQGMDYIEPGDADNSYLFRKIAGTSGIDGQRMPRNAPALSSTDIDSVRSWINRGATND